MSNSTSDSDKRSIYQAPPGKAPQNPMPKWWLASVILGGLVAFVAIIGRAEISRWYLASANNALVDHRYEDAVSSATNGLSWDPDSSRLVYARATANTKLKKFEEAIADYDEIIADASKSDPFGAEAFQAMLDKTQAFQRMDRYEEALEIWNEIASHCEDDYRLRRDTASQNAYAWALNGRAYTEALAHAAGTENIDIELALHDIEQAIDIRGEDDSMMVDTLGYLQLLNGHHEAAFYYLDQATKLMEAENDFKKRVLEENMRTVVDQRQFQDKIRELNEHFSVVLHHRGEAQRALGNEAEAESDIKRALELGFDPENGIW